MPQIEYTEPPSVKNPDAFDRCFLEIFDMIYGLGGGTVGNLDDKNVNVTGATAPEVTLHIADSTLHFTEGSIDHGNIAGLTDDDHTQYALLAGRPGGQTLVGGSATGNNLVLESNALNDGSITLGALVSVDETTGKLSLSPTVDGIQVTMPSAGSGQMTAFTVTPGGLSPNRYEKGFDISVVGGGYAAGGPTGGDITVGASDVLGHGIKCLMNGTYFDAGFIVDMPNVGNPICKGFTAKTASANFDGDMFYGDFTNASARGNFIAQNTTTGNKFAVDYNGNIINYSSLINPRGTFGALENYVKHPQALDNAVWVKSGFTVTKDSDVAIDGKTTVDKLTTSGGGSDSCTQDLGFDPVSSTRTIGFFLKADNTNFRIYLESGNESTFITTTTDDVAEWKFYSITNTFTAASTGNLQIRIWSDSGSIFDIFFDRPCGVTGSYPLGYIATSDATVARTYGGHVAGTFLLTANDEDSLSEQRAGDGQSGNLQELKDSSGVLQTKVTSAYHTVRNDNIKSIFGTGSDLEIYHDGTINQYKSNNGKHLFTGNVEVANPSSGVALTVGRLSGAANIKSLAGYFAIDSAGTALSLNRYVTDPVIIAQGGGNIGVFTASEFGSGVKVVGIANSTTVPSANPVGGGVLYADAGALKWRGSSGTVTTLALA